MRIAYFDAFSGAAGDMIVGALLDAGLPIDHLRSELERLHLPGWTMEAGRTVKSGISAIDFRVKDESPETERGFSAIREIIEASGLDLQVKERAIAIFKRLGEAEARVHNTTLDRIHFHEVGAIDCIIDICGACIATEALGIDRWVASPLPLGYGFTRCAHGRIPLPAPATVEILRDSPTYGVDIEGELVTPTGAAILATLASEWGRLPAMTPTAIGYGAGKKDFGPRPNLLRVVVGEAGPSTGSTVTEPADAASVVAVLEANIDDMNPEWHESAFDRLFQAGALDVALTPIVMKKGRPGVAITVIAPTNRIDPLTDTLFRETTTFGIRVSVRERRVLNRELRTVTTPHGSVKVKIGRRDSEIVTVSPEYEDCRRLSDDSGVPLKTVYRDALLACETDTL